MMLARNIKWKGVQHGIFQAEYKNQCGLQKWR